ncbi:MAG: polysaccharide biosynthesis protein [Gammaproteobacteria bacterium]|nr:polysaccharide biosynthesis protein [Gammaproteobacteria bacterium]MBU2477631.1 polysaccharide biosynthesis protein [Gammaproteobacteria bacterium]
MQAFKLNRWLRNPSVAFLHDLAMIPAAWFGAYWLRFNMGVIPPEFMSSALKWIPLVVIAQAGTFLYFQLYRGHWRFASIPDLIRIIKAVIAGTFSVMVIIFVISRMELMPRSIFPLYSVLLVGLLSFPRLLYRWIKDRRLYIGEGKRVLIVGAGRAGDMLARDMFRDPARSLIPVGFVDDKARKVGMDIQGVRVLGQPDQLQQLVEQYDIDLIILAIPSAQSKEMQRIVGFCEHAGVPFRTLPRFQDLVAGRVAVDSLREVGIDDLLGREPVSLDWNSIRNELQGKRVLVTGGGGSIGSELCRQVAGIGPASLVLFEQSEFNLFEIERELRKAYPQLELQVCLGDVTDTTLVDNVLAKHLPQVIFHAAAYKHVPMLEHQVRQAARNNILGTRTMALAADRHAVDAFVMISTDKAVNPANVMGASKRVAEIFCQNLDRRSATRFITVRFGNVLGSAGSVVPLFREQIRAGGPLTVTHPEMIRYFMTIPEACQLILQAGAMGKGGEIFVLDMGEPVKITYLAEQMIRLSGREPGKDIEIKFTGLRPGEKLFEELFHEKELSGTSHEKILLAQARPVDGDYLDQRMQRLEEACQHYDEPAIMKAIRELVPEMQAPAQAQESNVIPFEVKSKA